MLLVIGLVILSGFCDAEVSMKCSDHTNETITLIPSQDGVGGRYMLEWCTHMTPEDDSWDFNLSFDYYNPYSCGYKNKHSLVFVNLIEKVPNCNHVCLTYHPLDLLFGGCYYIETSFPNRHSMRSYAKVNISNPYNIGSFYNSNTSGIVVFHEDEVSIHFYTGIIPISYVNVDLVKRSAANNMTVLWSKRVTNKCTILTYEIVCRMHVSDGSYRAHLEFLAPWNKGIFGPKSLFIDFNMDRHSMLRAEAPAVAVPARWWIAGALAALCVVALLAMVALHCRRAAHARKLVLQEWLNRVEDKNKTAIEIQAPAGPILLLYARECSAAEPIITALVDLLETVAPDQVYDIGSPKTLAIAAAGGPEWVRSIMAQPDARVVLLQTPALQALHTPRLVTSADNVPRLEQPLLSNRCVYRAPAAGDWLLQLALRLLADTAHRPPQPYRKYYLATLEGLETEAVPYAVPFRRYVLPRHALTLLHDLSPQQSLQPTPDTPQPHLQHRIDLLAHASVGFLDYARANPDYLMEELLIF